MGPFIFTPIEKAQIHQRFMFPQYAGITTPPSSVVNHYITSANDYSAVLLQSSSAATPHISPHFITRPYNSGVGGRRKIAKLDPHKVNLRV